MGSYNDEYRKYYQSINKNYINNQGKINVHKNVIDKKKELINYTILQAVIAMILMITIVCMKYSKDVSMVKKYTVFENEINKKSSYTEMINDIKSVNIKEVFNNVKQCFEKVINKADIKL